MLSGGDGGDEQWLSDRPPCSRQREQEGHPGEEDILTPPSTAGLPWRFERTENPE